MAEDEMVERHHRLNGHELNKLQERVEDRKPGVRQFMGSKRVGRDLVTEQQKQPMNKAFI